MYSGPWHAPIGPDGNEEVCRVCGRDGQLVLCDRCPGAWHVRCLIKSHPGAAKGVLDEDRVWYCPECEPLERKRGWQGESEASVQAQKKRCAFSPLSPDDKDSIASRALSRTLGLEPSVLPVRSRVVPCALSVPSAHPMPSSVDRVRIGRTEGPHIVARDDERPKDIAAELSIEVGELLALNKGLYTGLRSDSKLHAGTRLRVPSQTNGSLVGGSMTLPDYSGTFHAIADKGDKQGKQHKSSKQSKYSNQGKPALQRPQATTRGGSNGAQELHVQVADGGPNVYRAERILDRRSKGKV